jgi:hypothetical protein
MRCDMIYSLGCGDGDALDSSVDVSDVGVCMCVLLGQLSDVVQ